MLSKAILTSSLISVAFATVFVTSPVSTTTDSGGQPASISWMDDGNLPSLATFGNATISIYAGNALQQTNLQTLSNGTNVAALSTLSFTPNPTIGPNSNEYFIRFQSINGKDNSSNPYEAFSAKFTLNNMTGNFSSIVQAEISGQSTAPLAGQTASGTTGPTSTPSSLTTSITSSNPTSTSSTSANTTTVTGGAMSLKAGWAGVVFGAVVGVTLF